MVAGEKEAVLEEQDAVPLRVAWRGDGEKTWSQLPRPFAIEDDFRTWLRRQFVPMDDAATAKMLGVALGVGHVVSVRQEDVGDAAQGSNVRTSGVTNLGESISQLPSACRIK